MNIIKKIRKKQNIEFLKKHPTFCVLPFVHLQMHVSNYSSQDNKWDPQNALVSSLCCSAPNPVEVRVKSSLNNLIKHRDFKSDREMFYANKLPVQCEYVCGLNYKHKTKREIVNVAHIDIISYRKVLKQPELKVIDYNFGNECNLACRMCSAGSSDQIAVLASKAVSSKDNSRKLIEFGINDLNPIISVKEQIENLKNGIFLREGVLSDKEVIKETIKIKTIANINSGIEIIKKNKDNILSKIFLTNKLIP